MERVFGEIADVKVGDLFESRRALAKAGVHRPLQAGISGTEGEGAESIVISGGYEDDIDLGDVIYYTGQGGQDPETKHQVGDQQLSAGNLALATSGRNGRPVRVVRGSGMRSQYSPKSGYLYSGLYYVDYYHQVTGRSGRLIWRFRLVRKPTKSQE